MDSDKIFLARAPPRPRFSINGITNVRLDSFLPANRVKIRVQNELTEAGRVTQASAACTRVISNVRSNEDARVEMYLSARIIQPDIFSNCGCCERVPPRALKFKIARKLDYQNVRMLNCWNLFAECVNGLFFFFFVETSTCKSEENALHAKAQYLLRYAFSNKFVYPYLAMQI